MHYVVDRNLREIRSAERYLKLGYQWNGKTSLMQWSKSQTLKGNA